MENYIDSDNQGKLIFVAGISGSGKSTLVRHAIETFHEDLEYLKTYTTRPPRTGEDDFEYDFVDEERFSQLSKDALLWDDFSYNNNRYGNDADYYRMKMLGGISLAICCLPDVNTIEDMRLKYKGFESEIIYVKIEEEKAQERVLARNRCVEAERFMAERSLIEQFESKDGYYRIFSQGSKLENNKQNFNGIMKELLHE